MFLAGILALFLTAAASNSAQAVWWEYTFDANCKGWSAGGYYGAGLYPGPYRVVGEVYLTTGAPYGEPGASAPVEISTDEVILPANPDPSQGAPWPEELGAEWTVELDGVYYARIFETWYSDYDWSPEVHALDPVMFECHPDGDFGGLTPGFWKNHLLAWEGYAPGDDFDTVFGVDAFDPDRTFLEALKAGGGGLNALGRHAVAALLNAAHPLIDYPYTIPEIIAAVQAALSPGGDVEGTKDDLDDFNNLGIDISLKSPNTTAGKSELDEELEEGEPDKTERKAAKAAEKAAKKAAKEARKAAKRAAKEAKKAAKEAEKAARKAAKEAD